MALGQALCSIAGQCWWYSYRAFSRSNAAMAVLHPETVKYVERRNERQTKRGK